MFSLNTLFGDNAEILQARDFQLLLLANIQTPLGIVIVSPILDSLIGPFGTSSASIGLMISFYTAPSIVMIPIAGMIADRIGRKPVLVSALGIFGLAGLAISLTANFYVVLGLRFLQGIGFAGIMPTLITSIGDLYTGDREATGQGFRFMMSGLSGTVFPVIAGSLVIIAWQMPFLLYAVALPTALTLYLKFEDPAGGGDSDADDGLDAASYRRALLYLLGRRRVFSLMIARALPVIAVIGFLTYNSLIVIQVLDGTPAQAGVLVAIYNFVLAITSSQAGRVTGLVDSRFSLLVGANACIALGFAGMFVAPSVAVAAVGVAALGMGVGVTLSLYRSIVTGLVTEDLRAGLVSLSEAGGQFTSTATPILMGGLISVTTPLLGLEVAMQIVGLVTAIFTGVGGILCLFLAKASQEVSMDDFHNGS